MRLRAHFRFLQRDTEMAKKTERGAGFAEHGWRTAADPQGRNAMGLKTWLSRHKPGVLLMVVLLLEVICFLLTASWLPWNA